MIKYILFGGNTKSAHDNDIHFVSANQLRILYRLKPAECVLIDGAEDRYKLTGLPAGLRTLHPRYDGKYEV